MLGPSGNSANRTSGQVVKNIALKMYSRGVLGNISNYAQQLSPSTPLLAASTASSDSQVSKALKARGTRKISAAQPAAVSLRTVPDVRGYDAPSAIRILERAGNQRQRGRLRTSGLAVAASRLAFPQRAENTAETEDLRNFFVILQVI